MPPIIGWYINPNKAVKANPVIVMFGVLGFFILHNWKSGTYSYAIKVVSHFFMGVLIYISNIDYERFNDLIIVGLSGWWFPSPCLLIVIILSIFGGK